MVTDLDLDLPPWYRLAGEALRLAVLGDRAAAYRTVEQLLAEHGPDAVPEAMCAWADAVLAYLQPPDHGDTITLTIRDAITGQPATVDRMPAPSVWAGQLIAARAADDEPTFRALVNAPTSDREYSARVSAMLMTCAINVRHAKTAGLRPVHQWPIGGQPWG